MGIIKAVEMVMMVMNLDYQLNCFYSPGLKPRPTPRFAFENWNQDFQFFNMRGILIARLAGKEPPSSWGIPVSN